MHKMIAALAVAAASSTLAAAPALAAVPAAGLKATYATNTGIPGANIRLAGTTRTITVADIGKQVSVRITPTSGATLDCNTATFGYVDTASSFHKVTVNYQESGCWSGGALYVTTVTPDAVGSAYQLGMVASFTAPSAQFSAVTTVNGASQSWAATLTKP